MTMIDPRFTAYKNAIKGMMHYAEIGEHGLSEHWLAKSDALAADLSANMLPDGYVAVKRDDALRLRSIVQYHALSVERLGGDKANLDELAARIHAALTGDGGGGLTSSKWANEIEDYTELARENEPMGTLFPITEPTPHD